MGCRTQLQALPSLHPTAQQVSMYPDCRLHLGLLWAPTSPRWTPLWAIRPESHVSLICLLQGGCLSHVPSQQILPYNLWLLWVELACSHSEQVGYSAVERKLEF